MQDNHSRSGRGVVRGMHFQVGAGPAKLVRCARGAIFDVVVDLRSGSPTFGQWEGFELTTRTCASSTARSASRTASACSASRRRGLQAADYYDGAAERGIA